MSQDNQGVAAQVPPLCGPTGGASDESPAKPAAANADNDDRYWDYDDDCAECWQCGGNGFVYGCAWDWQCDTWDGDSCLCTRPCDICHPPKPNPAMSAILSDAFAQARAEQ